MSILKHISADRQNARATLARFFRGEDGAVTIDWVVLTGFIVFLGIAASFFVATSVPMVADKVSTNMKEMTVMPE